MSIIITALPVASTIDGALDTFPIVTNSLNTTQQISRNTFLNLASAPVGLTDTQTLTNKTLTSPTISGPTFSGTLAGTYTIGGTPTFPASVVQLTTTQTLTNKTLTSPTINAPTITNATINTDTITGFTVSNSGTIYGISVTTGTIGTAAIANSAITNAKLGLTVSSVANSGSAGGTIYYANLGGLKMAWGSTSSLVASGAAITSTAYGITWPIGFFSTIQQATVSATPGTATNSQYIVAIPNSAVSTTSWTFYLGSFSGSNGTTSQASFFAIGT